MGTEGLVKYVLYRSCFSCCVQRSIDGNSCSPVAPRFFLHSSKITLPPADEWHHHTSAPSIDVGGNRKVDDVALQYFNSVPGCHGKGEVV